MRVLLVGNGGEREPGRRYYTVERKLFNGFTRNGHSVVFFSDRDVARASNFFRTSRAGWGAANAKFLGVVRDFAPQLIVFMQAGVIATETFAQAKDEASRPRLAQVCVDPLFRPVNVAYLMDRARVAEATFVTTGGAVLARFSTGSNMSAFIPNPVDPSIEDLRNFAREDLPIDVFFAANAGKERLDDARRATPRLMREAGLACGFHGFDDRPGLYGAAYFAALAQARMGLNLNTDRETGALARAPEEDLYLYSSDRLAQLTGCGALTLSFRMNRLMELYEDGREMVFADDAQGMCEAALRFRRDDGERRRIAEAGWRRAQGEYNERLVAGFIEEVTMRRPLSRTYGWPTRLW